MDKLGLITREEARRILKVSAVTMSRYIREEKVTFYQVGKFKLFDPTELLAEAKKPKTVKQ